MVENGQDGVVIVLAVHPRMEAHLADSRKEGTTVTRSIEGIVGTLEPMSETIMPIAKLILSQQTSISESRTTAK